MKVAATESQNIRHVFAHLLFDGVQVPLNLGDFFRDLRLLFISTARGWMSSSSIQATDESGKPKWLEREADHY